MRCLSLPLLAGLALTIPAMADTLRAPAAVERRGMAEAVLDLDPPPVAAGRAELTWTDALGRVVAQSAADYAAGQPRLRFPLDLARALAMDNRLVATRPGQAPASAQFLARPAAESWRRFEVLYWHSDRPAKIAALRAAGLSGGKITAMRSGIRPAAVQEAVAPFLAADQRFYLENIASDFYAAYHRWLPDRAVNAAFLAAQQAYRRNSTDPEALQRVPSLADPAWQGRINERLADHVRAFGPWRPVFYNLGDETGIADLAAQWDFDYAPVSLAAFRRWLQQHYGSLGALAAQWGRAYASWDEVRPMTTAEALAAPDGNLSAWSDFKDFMDFSFARALREGTEAVHAADPAALAGIEGAQVPGWGGYDYTRLPGAVDVMEAYEAGDNLQIAHALNPDLVLMTTTFREGPWEAWRLWHTALLGVRGAVVWDDADRFLGAEGQVGPRARDLAPVLAELRGGLGALLIAAHAEAGPVGVLYSPASQRLLWLEGRRGDPAWASRQAEDELAPNPGRQGMETAVDALERLGLPPKWVTPAMLAQGVPPGVRVLLLPRVLALSDAEVAALRRFIAAGGVVLADVPPGAWDEHGRPRAAPPADIAARVPDFGRTTLSAVLAAQGIAPVPLRQADGVPLTDVAIRRYVLGDTTLLALQHAQPGVGPAVKVTLGLGGTQWVRDLRDTRPAAQGAEATFLLDPVLPTLLALRATPLPAPVLTAPASLPAGGDARLRLTSPAPVLEVEIRDPAGDVVPRYGGLVWPRDGEATWQVPFALNDASGRWEVRVTDPLGGGEVRAGISVGAAAPGR